MKQQFASPPEHARPWTYWYCMDGNFTREGITADLEAMHQAGIRGVLYMDVDLFFPKGPVRPLTPEWRKLMQHAMSEAARLGIRWNMNNDGGWAGSGGPWITPEHSMQVVVWSETAVEGPGDVRATLSQPEAHRGYYNDIAVLAFPTPAGDSKRMADSSPRLTYGLDRTQFDFSRLIDGNPGTEVLLPQPSAGQPQYLNIDFPEPFTAQSASISLNVWSNQRNSLVNSLAAAEIQVSDDAKNYRTVAQMSLYWPESSANFGKVSSRHYRVLIKPDLATNSSWGVFAKGLPLGEIELHEGLRIQGIPGKALYLRHGAYSAQSDVLAGGPEFPEDSVIHSRQILDISKHLDADGLLTWNVPPGKWTVLRFGHTSTAIENHPAPKELMGLECDKLSKKAIEIQFNSFVEKLLQDEAAAGAKVIGMAHVDSWEAGSQNWSQNFREEFQAKRGYDPVPYLPILTGRAIESSEQSERFLWDWRRTIADLLIENYADHLKKICHEHGLTLSIEGYGAGPLDELAYGGQADVPMGEFWVGDDDLSRIFNLCNKEMASSAHVYGRPIVAAEAFTAGYRFANWSSHPFQFKPLGDLAFTWGINRFVLSQFMMQPWKDRKPGMELGMYGSHIDRGNTWWEQASAWFTYLGRCQTLLQRGSFVADVAYLGSESVPYRAPWRKDLSPPLPPGYDFDFLPPQVLLKDATVHDGRITLASGMSYRLLVLQPGQAMTPVLLRKIKELVSDGATVVGPRPVESPSLSEFPECDTEVRALAEELWGECDGSSIKENRFGNGRVIWGQAIDDVLTELQTLPDFACAEAAVGEEIRFIHRIDGSDDLYFVASGVPEARRFLCTFRVHGQGKRPEFWWPDSGRIEPVTVFNESVKTAGTAPAGPETVTLVTIPIGFDPYGSVFVVFRASAEPGADHVVSIERDGAALYSLTPVLQYQFSASDLKQAGAKEWALETRDEGRYTFATAAGHSLQAEVPQLPAPMAIPGPWNLNFPVNSGAPRHVTLDRLISWTQHPNQGVRYFSGKATYRRQFRLRDGMAGANRRLWLDLGRVSVIAEVTLNGENLGILWKPPFAVGISDFLTNGLNDLEIHVVNLWPNRMIGDEHLPEDCEWATPSTPRDPYPAFAGLVIDRWPQWLLDNKPRPSGRIAFPTWKHWGKDDPLLVSGLLGPVQIFAKGTVKLTTVVGV